MHIVTICVLFNKTKVTMKTSRLLAAVALVCAIGQAHATKITFTGGVVTRHDGTTAVTANNINYQNVDYYTEGGFKLQFVGATTAFSSNVGNYYGRGDDVIHGHWATGSFGTLTQIRVTKVDNTSFNLTSFGLTSNTDQGGGHASGNEQAFIHASIDGTTESYSQMLPPENWGTLPPDRVVLGSDFSGIKAFYFTVNDKVDCFGMDDFFLNETDPTLPPSAVAVPEPETYAMMLGGLGLLAFVARRRNRKG